MGGRGEFEILGGGEFKILRRGGGEGEFKILRGEFKILGGGSLRYWEGGFKILGEGGGSLRYWEEGSLRY